MARIAILMHEHDDEASFAEYAVATLAEFWREDGHEVFPVFGPALYVAADLALLHVDLSVVPAPYLELARRYPIALNARLADIRRRAFATSLVQRGDPWPGPVIVKTDLNYHGQPEQRLAMRARKHAGAASGPMRVLKYQLFRSLAKVPARLLDMPELVVQKFQPEREGELYCVRSLHCLGSYVAATRIRGRFPIVSSANCLPGIAEVEPDPRILAARERLGVDYGKLDYVVAGGEAILLDVNKTIGAGTLNDTPELRALRRQRANGLYKYLALR